MGIELLNEDSYFFWTFTYDNVPPAEMHILEKQFGDWLVKKYGSLDKALAAWNGLKDKHDDFAAGRVGFRPLWNMAHEKTPRDQDTATFLYDSQHQFYADTVKYIRSLGYKGLITCGNWTTADNAIFGPLERMSYTAGDFIDRHGYFECDHTGDNAAWSIRDGHEYFDRSGLRFDGSQPGKPKEFTNPVMDLKYDHMPSMISETTFCRPNRYRTEAALYYASYAALQNSNSFINFAFDGTTWAVKPGFWMQQWTLASPTMMGQFPAAALIYRKGLVAPGAQMADINLTRSDLFALKGTPLPEIANLDELRKADVPNGQKDLTAQTLIDPLIHFVGQTDVNFVDSPKPSLVENYKPYINYDKQTIDSSTGQLHLDFNHGILTINAPEAQGVDGNLKAAGDTQLKDITLQSDLDLGSVIVVSLDGQPIATSNKLLLQVMSEEENAGWKTHEKGDKKVIDSIGHDPWMVKDIHGTVALKRSDARQMKVEALNPNGYPMQDAGTADKITLLPQAAYYVISK